MYIYSMCVLSVFMAHLRQWWSACIARLWFQICNLLAKTTLIFGGNETEQKMESIAERWNTLIGFAMFCLSLVFVVLSTMKLKFNHAMIWHEAVRERESKKYSQHTHTHNVCHPQRMFVSTKLFSPFHFFPHDKLSFSVKYAYFHCSYV